MNEIRYIPEKFHDQVNAMPEYKYGVTRIRVTLDDHSRCDDVFVAWGNEIVKVGTSVQIPFDPSRIVPVECQRSRPLLTCPLDLILFSQLVMNENLARNLVFNADGE